MPPLQCGRSIQPRPADSARASEQQPRCASMRRRAGSELSITRPSRWRPDRPRQSKGRRPGGEGDYPNPNRSTERHTHAVSKPPREMESLENLCVCVLPSPWPRIRLMFITNRGKSKHRTPRGDAQKPNQHAPLVRDEVPRLVPKRSFGPWPRNTSPRIIEIRYCCVYRIMCAFGCGL